MVFPILHARKLLCRVFFNDIVWSLPVCTSHWWRL